MARAGQRRTCRRCCPTATYSAKNSLYNTPPTFAIYMVRNVLEWVKDQGGLAAMEKTNRAKGDLLYGVMADNPDFYRVPSPRTAVPT